VRRTTIVAVSLLAGLVVLGAVTLVAIIRTESRPAQAPPMEVSSALREAVAPEGIMEHERRFQAIAEANGGNRAAGTPGYDASAEYIAERLREAGYRVTVQEFELPEDAGGSESTTSNVVAEMPGGGDARNTVMVGAHLDSVPEGPGINDNGSGSATILEIAEEMSELDAGPRNKVRFAFWGAEEIGLIGSTHYVHGLNESELGDISAYLNFDMVGSPNHARFVYGSDEVVTVFEEYFAARNLDSSETLNLSGRSDHGPFEEEGIPAGGLFSGAGGTKSGAQAEDFGGESGEAYDSCYHAACDDIGNVDREAVDELSDAAAHTVAVFAEAK